MPPWNVDDFETISSLYHAQQPAFFYDGRPSDLFPQEIIAIDKEIDQLAERVRQQTYWVYRPPFDDQPAFSQDVVNRARPLLTRRRVACERFNAMSPFHSLFPNEIISAIFRHVVASGHHPRGVTGLAAHFVQPRLRETLVLASVTKAWREIALHEPTLWSSFILCPAQSPQQNKDALDLFELFLRRSRPVGLYVDLELDHYGWWHDFERLMQIIRREAPRIKTLSLSSPHALSEITLSFPNADTVYIRSDPHLFAPLSLPAVSSLSLEVDTIDFAMAYCSTLTFLHLPEISWQQFKHVLDNCARLQTLEAYLFAPQENDPPAQHDNLESLTIHHGNPLPFLKLRRLTSLSLTGGGYKALPDFIARSECILRRIGVGFLDELEYVFDIDTIEHLHVQVDPSHVLDFFLIRLAESLVVTAWVQNLRTVTISVDSLDGGGVSFNPPRFFVAIKLLYDRLSKQATEAPVKKLVVKLRQVDIFTPPFHAVLECPWALGSAPILINGARLVHHLTDTRTLSPWSYPPGVGIPRRDRLDFVDRCKELYFGAWRGLRWLLTPRPRVPDRQWRARGLFPVIKSRLYRFLGWELAWGDLGWGDGGWENDGWGRTC